MLNINPANRTIKDDHQGLTIADNITEPTKHTNPEIMGNDCGFLYELPICQPREEAI